MRTKEAVLNEVAKKRDTDLHFTAHTFIEDYAGGSRGYYRDDVAETAMEEFARERAIDYERWKRLNDREGGTWWDKIRGKTPAQIFDLYLQETKQV